MPIRRTPPAAANLQQRALVDGTGDGSINVGGQSRVYFNSLRQMFRPAVLLTDGMVVLGSASHGDNGPYHGWMLTYDEGSLALTGVLNTSPNSGLAGIWQGGAPIAVDPQGYFYFETGNGPFNSSPSNFPNGDTSQLPIDGDYGDSFVKVALDPTTSQGNQNVNGWGLKVVDYFTPEDQASLNSADEDLGSGGPIILPDSAGSALTAPAGRRRQGRQDLPDRPGPHGRLQPDRCRRRANAGRSRRRHSQRTGVFQRHALLHRRL